MARIEPSIAGVVNVMMRTRLHSALLRPEVATAKSNSEYDQLECCQMLSLELIHHMWRSMLAVGGWGEDNSAQSSADLVGGRSHERRD
jgi:hypothetical protein